MGHYACDMRPDWFDKKQASKPAKQWSGNIKGMEHYGSPDDPRWSSVVTIADDLYQVLMWARGNGLIADKVATKTLAAARARGEAWANTGTA